METTYLVKRSIAEHGLPKEDNTMNKHPLEKEKYFVCHKINGMEYKTTARFGRNEDSGENNFWIVDDDGKWTTIDVIYWCEPLSLPQLLEEVMPTEDMKKVILEYHSWRNKIDHNWHVAKRKERNIYPVRPLTQDEIYEEWLKSRLLKQSK